MKKLKYLFLSFILIVFIFNINIVIESTKYSSILFFNKIFITIVPFIILSDILIYFDYHIFLKNTIGKFLSKLFNIDPSTSIIFILSILTCSPNNAIFTKDMLNNDEIDINTANKIMCFTYFQSIPFVIGTIGVELFKSFKIGLFLYFIMLINNIMIGLFLRREKSNYVLKNNVKNKSSFFEVLKNSIMKSINTSLIILGNLIVFTIIVNLITKYISIKPYILSILTGLLELTSGIISVSKLNIPFNIKFALTSLILNFSSLSILFQSFSILSDYKINIKKTLTIKLIFSIISFLLILICTR